MVSDNNNISCKKKSPVKSKWWLFVQSLLLVFLLSYLVIAVHGSRGKFFYLESVGIIFLAVLSFIGLLNYQKRWGERVLLIVYVFYLANLSLLWLYAEELHLVLLLLSMLGFILALPSLKDLQGSKKRRLRSQPFSQPFNNSQNELTNIYTSPSVASPSVEPYTEPHSQVFNQPQEEDDTAENLNFVKKLRPYSSGSSGAKDKEGLSSSGKVAFKPGKYVASQRSNIYHEPKCDWAKKIRSSRRVWFASKEDAWEKGYKSHDCVN